jgi:hypothetical protein
MKATLEFNIDGSEFSDGEFEFELAVKAKKLAETLIDIKDYLREQEKYGDGTGIRGEFYDTAPEDPNGYKRVWRDATTPYETITALKDKFWELINENDCGFIFE